MKPQKSYAQRCFDFLMNELKPRARKLGVEVNVFMPHQIAAGLICAEMEGIVTRKQTREYLDQVVKLVNEQKDI